MAHKGQPPPDNAFSKLLPFIEGFTYGTFAVATQLLLPMVLPFLLLLELVVFVVVYIRFAFLVCFTIVKS